MSDGNQPRISRRTFTKLSAGFGLSATGVVTSACSASDVVQSSGADLSGRAVFIDSEVTSDQLIRRVSGFSSMQWQDHFGSLSGGAILVDTSSRSLHFWPPSGAFYKVYPTSVPLTQELTRRGRTSVIRKQVGPDWSPTPNMLRRDPTLPPYVGPGPQNPLGTHALYLGWKYYRIHGTNDTRKIGRMSSNGCIGLYNEHIEELFGMTNIGTKVRVI